MSVYRKLIAAFVGLAVLILNRHYGLDLIGTESYLTELLIGFFTLSGVWGLRNEASRQDR